MAQAMVKSRHSATQQMVSAVYDVTHNLKTANEVANVLSRIMTMEMFTLFASIEQLRTPMGNDGHIRAVIPLPPRSHLNDDCAQSASQRLSNRLNVNMIISLTSEGLVISLCAE